MAPGPGDPRICGRPARKPRNAPIPYAMHLDEFRVTYPAFLPKRTPGDPDECVQMTTGDGLRLLVGPTNEPITIEQAPNNADDAAIGRYLWVIGKTA